MRSIEKRFQEIKKKNPYWSSLICFTHVIRGMKLNKQTIRRNFKKIVDKQDYEKNEKMEILRYLEGYAKLPEDNQK